MDVARSFILTVLIILIAVVSFTPSAGFSAPQFLRGTIWEQAAAEHSIDPVLLYSIATWESARKVGNNRVKPWPYAMNVNGYGISLYPKSRQEAEKLLTWLMSQGITNIDVGLGQVNLRYHRHRVQEASDLLEPKTNLRVAAAILHESLASSSDRELAVGRYHSGTTWRARQYGGKVICLYDRLREYARLREPSDELPGVTAEPMPKPVKLPGLLFAAPTAVSEPLWPAWKFSFLMAPLRRVGGRHGE